jgi:hypothetical protein
MEYRLALPLFCQISPQTVKGIAAYIDHTHLYPTAKFEPSGKALQVVGTMCYQAARCYRLKTFLDFLRFCRRVRG